LAQNVDLKSLGTFNGHQYFSTNHDPDFPGQQVIIIDPHPPKTVSTDQFGVTHSGGVFGVKFAIGPAVSEAEIQSAKNAFYAELAAAEQLLKNIKQPENPNISPALDHELEKMFTAEMKSGQLIPDPDERGNHSWKSMPPPEVRHAAQDLLRRVFQIYAQDKAQMLRWHFPLASMWAANDMHAEAAQVYRWELEDAQSANPKFNQPRDILINYLKESRKAGDELAAYRFVRDFIKSSPDKGNDDFSLTTLAECQEKLHDQEAKQTWALKEQLLWKSYRDGPAPGEPGYQAGSPNHNPYVLGQIANAMRHQDKNAEATKIERALQIEQLRMVSHRWTANRNEMEKLYNQDRSVDQYLSDDTKQFLRGLEPR
jgi:hypothetical protein